jgi:serine kinase of HPr protein (carbohydrate metabolism regulator)
MTPTIHATAVLIGARAVLIRGPSGAGKSRLALDLIHAAQNSLHSALAFARLVGDDRVHVEAMSSRLLVRPASTLAGLLEVRGLGILRLPYEPVAQIGLIIDLAAQDAARLPAVASQTASISGISLPRLTVAAGEASLPLFLAWLTTAQRLPHPKLTSS